MTRLVPRPGKNEQSNDTEQESQAVDEDIRESFAQIIRRVEEPEELIETEVVPTDAVSRSSVRRRHTDPLHRSGHHEILHRGRTRLAQLRRLWSHAERGGVVEQIPTEANHVKLVSSRKFHNNLLHCCADNLVKLLALLLASGLVIDDHGCAADNALADAANHAETIGCLIEHEIRCTLHSYAGCVGSNETIVVHTPECKFIKCYFHFVSRCNSKALTKQQASKYSGCSGCCYWLHL